MTRWPAVFVVRCIGLNLSLLVLLLSSGVSAQQSPELLHGLKWRLIGPIAAVA